MIRRILLVLALLVGAAVVLPPLWFAVFPAPASALPPPGRRVVLASGVGVNVVERGVGPPIVLAHGHPGSAYDWRLLTDALAARNRRVLAYDRVGYGHSDARDESSYTFQQNAVELVGLLEALDLRDATVVGWSYGGGTAIVAAHRDASRMGRLVLVGSVGPGIEEREEPPIAALVFSRPVIAWLAAVPPVARGVRAAMSEVAFSEQPQPDWWLPGLNGNLDQPQTLHTMIEEGLAFGPPIPDPTGIGPRVLVIHGDDDRLVPISVGRELDRRAPHAELRIVEGGSHMLPVTHPDLLADAIVAFTSE